MRKFIYGLMALLFASSLLAVDRITVTFRVTNYANVFNGTNYTLNGDTRTATNAARTSKMFTTNNSNISLATNIYNQIAFAPFAGGVNILWTDTNAFQIIGTVGGAMTISTPVTNWVSFSYNTQNVTTMTSVRVPINGEAYMTNQTNIASQLVKGISDLASNRFSMTAIVMTNFFPRTNGYSTNGVFDKPASTGAVIIAAQSIGGTLASLTNGYVTNLIAENFTVTNFNSPGSGALSLQLGSNALARGVRSIAIGTGALATNDDTLAVGSLAQATNLFSTAIGNSSLSAGARSVAVGYSSKTIADAAVAVGQSAQALNFKTVAVGGDSYALGDRSISIGAGQAMSNFDISIGNSAVASGTFSMALGIGAQASNYASVAIGYLSSTLTSNQVMLGTSSEHVYAPGHLNVVGNIQAGSFSNLTTTVGSTNILRGDLSTPPATFTSIAAGANTAIPGTNVILRFTGTPGAVWSINGLTQGRAGKQITLYNYTGYQMTIANESGTEPTAANRIKTLLNADVVTGTNSVTQLFYDELISRWVIINHYP